MQRYSTASCGGVGSNSIGGGTSIRDSSRTDSSFTSSSFTVNSRRSSQLAPYKLKCEKESLSGRLGPPDFYPQTPNCPEETLTREYLQSGYKETVDGIEEAKEIVLSQAGVLTKPVILRCKEAIRKHLRSINESRAQKRKAGQCYGVPLSGQLIVKPLLFPELRSCGEDSRKKWIEALSQHHKGLRSLADHIPHGFRKKVLLEVIVRHNVPLLRATWFIKVTYLNQVRPNPSGISSGAPDKSQATRTELWTRDVIEYLQYLFDDLLLKNGLYPSNSVRDQQSPNLLSIPSHQRTDVAHSPAEGSEPSLWFKWRYMINLLKWHFAEGLLSPSLIVDWMLSQLQEKESVEALELLLPIILDLIDIIVLSQTYVRMFIDTAIHFLHDLCPGGTDVITNAKRPHLVAALVEMLRYLLLTVPDTFVTLDCFPLPAIVVPDMVNAKILDMPSEKNFNSKIPEGGAVDQAFQDSYCRYLSFGSIASSLQRRALNLAKIANPNIQGHGVAKLLQALDKAVVLGDIKGAYACLFEDLSDGAIEENWVAEVSSCLRSSLMWIGTGSSSIISAIFFLLEWATCDFRDFRTCQPLDVKFTGRKDFSQIYIAVLLLKLKSEDMLGSSQLKTGNSSLSRTVVKGVSPHSGLTIGMPGECVSHLRGSPRSFSKTKSADILQSPGQLHDIVVCWLDQHEVGKGGGGFKRLEILMMELIREGIFYPQAYVRQLLVSGIMDKTETTFYLERRRRHLRILKQLPGSYLLEILDESELADVSQLREAVHVFSNERKLVLDGISGCHSVDIKAGPNGSVHPNSEKCLQKSVHAKDVSPSLLDKRKNHSRSSKSFFNKQVKPKAQVPELKLSIASLLYLPRSCCSTNKVHRSEPQGSTKRGVGSLEMKFDLVEGKSGCEECTKTKRQRINDEKFLFSGISLNHSDDDDTWWMRKEAKSSESFKEEHPKSTKSSSRGRPKSVRKTQSLAQLAAARIEGSQGTSTSHICESKVNCTHHMPSSDVENILSVDGTKIVPIANVGKAIKKLRWLEKRSITIWLFKSIKQLVEGNEYTVPKVSPPFSPLNEERSVVKWKLREDVVSSVLYLLDISLDLYSAVKFLIWLFPHVPSGISVAHVGRTAMMMPKNSESHVVDVGESYVVAALHRYENTLVALDLLPEVLSAAMRRSINMIASNGRASGSLAFIYARNLLRRYGKLSSVVRWEKSFRSTCDQRLLAELETGRPLDAEFTYSLGVPSGIEDVDDFLRQKISGRLSRAGQSMKEIVQKQLDDAIYGKERKLYGPTGTVKFSTLENLDAIYQMAQQIVLILLDCMRQHRGSTQEWDPSLVAAAISAVVGNVGPACSSYQNYSSNSLNHSQQIVRLHLACLCLLKEAFGERMNRVFEIALAAEASSIISSAFATVKTQRGQFQLSPEMHDINQNSPNDVMNNFSKMMSGRSSKAPAAVSALVISAIIHGVTSLERMITAFRLKEGLDFMQFIKSARSSANGLSRSAGNFKLDHSVEVYVHWFRLLVGNFRTVFDGLVVDILGEAHTFALSRMQRMLPLAVAFPLAYSIFAMVIWRPYVFNSNIATREDIQLYQGLSVAIGDAIRHQPFRDLCLRDSQTLFDIMASDATEPEFASILELHNADKHFRIMAFVPLRARLFLNAIVDCRMPSFTVMQEDGSWHPGRGEPRHSEKEGNLRDQLVHVLDTLQPAKFHWQWVELRLLLNEQALIEKIESQNMSLVEAIRSLSPTAENFSLSEDESTFTEIVLTRLLVRPDAASLYSEVCHLLGRSLDEKLLLLARFLLSGTDVLYGRMSLRQRLVSFAQHKLVSTKVRYWKPWGWSRSVSDVSASRDEKRKMDASSLEEGEVVEEGHESKKFGKPTFQVIDSDMVNTNQLYVVDKSLLELVLPCIDRSTIESRNMFASAMIKQLSSIDQQINSLTRGSNKQIGGVSAVEGSTKGGNRKGMRGGSPGLGRWPTGSKDMSPPSIAALRASIWLRLQFLLRLLPINYADREQSNRNSKYIFYSVLLHLLGSPIVYEDFDVSAFSVQRSSSRRDSESMVEASFRSSLDLSGDSLFDRILSVLHGLLSGSKPGWLKGRSISKSTVKSPRDFLPFDRELVERLQADLDRMQLPASVRWRLQAAMPVLRPTPPLTISCQPPVLSSKFLSSLYLLFSTSGNHDTNSSSHRAVPSGRPPSNASGKNNPSLHSDSELEIDPWTLLEDGTGSISPSNSGGLGGSSSDQLNLKACYWLKGAVRSRRTDITYVGTMDEDS